MPEDIGYKKGRTTYIPTTGEIIPLLLAGIPLPWEVPKWVVEILKEIFTNLQEPKRFPAMMKIGNFHIKISRKKYLNLRHCLILINAGKLEQVNALPLKQKEEAATPFEEKKIRVA